MAPDRAWEVGLEGGWLSLRANGFPLVRIRGLRPEIEFAGRRKRWIPLLRAGAGCFESEGTWGGLRLRLWAEERREALVLHSELRHAGAEPVRLDRVAPLALDAGGECRIGSGAGRWSAFRQGYQSWTGTRRFTHEQVDPDPISPVLATPLIDVRNRSPRRRGCFRSSGFVLVKNRCSGEALLLGFLTCTQALGIVEVELSERGAGLLRAELDWDGVPLRPGARLQLEPLWVGASFDEHELLDAYARAVGAAMGARVPATPRVGWCSWYCLFTRVTETDVLENLDALSRLRPQLPCDFVQVDDGYQQAVGDWLVPNEKFPHGMAWLADRIRSAGFDPGIWIAPFLASSGSRLVAEHPDWLVRNRWNRPRFAIWNPVWGWRRCYALDTTHPGALKWLARVIRTLVHDWGYRMLKLDFLYAAAVPGKRRDSGATRAAALRRGLEVIRDAAGPDTFLLGCGCPLAPAVGLVDAMRIGPDVAPFWRSWLSRWPQRGLHGTSAEHAIRNSLTRAFLHRRWWLNDPDCLLARDRGTRLTLAEVQALATAIALTGGMAVLSDRVAELSPERLSLVRRALDLRADQARVVDLLEADTPEWIVARSGQGVAVAVFNFADAPQRKQVDLSRCDLHLGPDRELGEFWTGERVPLVGGRVDFGVLPPHGCKVVVLA